MPFSKLIKAAEPAVSLARVQQTPMWDSLRHQMRQKSIHSTKAPLPNPNKIDDARLKALETSPTEKLTTKHPDTSKYPNRITDADLKPERTNRLKSSAYG